MPALDETLLRTGRSQAGRMEVKAGCSSISSGMELTKSKTGLMSIIHDYGQRWSTYFDRFLLVNRQSEVRTHIDR